jgi:NhaP-type Na+/H+ or K+/H+ antiporter
MKLTLRDLIATVVVAAIGVPYIGYLLNGEMPFIKDPRGMSAVGLVLGAVAYLVLRSTNAHDRVGEVETVAVIVSLALGFAALVLAEAAAADVLLAVFMGSILVVWAFELIDHAGLVHWHDRPHGLSHA